MIFHIYASCFYIIYSIMIKRNRSLAYAYAVFVHCALLQYLIGDFWGICLKIGKPKNQKETLF